MKLYADIYNIYILVVYRIIYYNNIHVDIGRNVVVQDIMVGMGSEC